MPTQEAAPTATPTATPLPTNTPQPGPTTIPTATPDVSTFHDGFSNPNSGWETGSNQFSSAAYLNTDGAGGTDIYAVQSRTFDQICIGPAPQQAPANGSFAVTVFKDSIDDDSVYGLSLVWIPRPLAATVNTLSSTSTLRIKPLRSISLTAATAAT
ncbi:MAG: hypothetical protein R2867_18480 [Caldilineaceae bacterium]